MIRGKIPNAFKETKAKFLANQEVSSIITIIGGGYGKNFDISKVKFDKIIFLADADPDGSHIDCLLLRFFIIILLRFYMFAPCILHVYCTMTIEEKSLKIIDFSLKCKI